MPRLIRVVIPLVMLAACSDPQRPCDPADACEFEGVHLDVAVALPSTAVSDPQDGKPGMAPEHLRLVITVVNRGDTRSEPAFLHAAAAYFAADTTVPALRPGQHWRVELPLLEREPARILAGTDIDSAWVLLGRGGDLSELLVQTTSPAFHLLVPAARLEVAPVAGSIQLGHEATISLRVTNVSRAAVLEAGHVHMSLVQGWDHVFPAWPTALPVPRLEPGSVYQEEFALTVPPDAGWLAGTLDYHLLACFGTLASGPRTYLDMLSGCGWSPTEFPAVPDLSRCTAATAIPGQLVPTTATCPGWREWAYWALDATEGTRYRADRNVTIYTKQGSILHEPAAVTEWVAPFTGQVYVVVKFPGPAPELRLDTD